MKYGWFMDYSAVRAVVGNGSSNIYKIASNVINNLGRPSYLCRETISNHPLIPSGGSQTLHG